MCRHVALKSVYVATNLYKNNTGSYGRFFHLITRVASVDKVAVPGEHAASGEPSVLDTQGDVPDGKAGGGNSDYGFWDETNFSPRI